MLAWARTLSQVAVEPAQSLRETGVGTQDQAAQHLDRALTFTRGRSGFGDVRILADVVAGADAVMSLCNDECHSGGQFRTHQQDPGKRRPVASNPRVACEEWMVVPIRPTTVRSHR